MKRINVKGAIIPDEEKWVYDLFDMPSTSPKDVTNVLSQSNGEEIQLIINSGGGDVFSASEIYSELMDYEGNVHVKIVGVAASAATVIASAGDNVEMSPTANYMIHCASTIQVGNSDDMKHTSVFLESVDKSITSAYMKKTGMSQDELLDLMSKETWMSAEEAKEKGFIDGIMFEDTPRAVASLPGALPQQVIDKMRTNALKEPEKVTVDEIKSLMTEMKSEIINELKTNKKPDKEPKQETNNLQRFFSNL